MTQNITFIISPKGEIKVEAHGFDGLSCTDATKFLETALGRKTAEQFKPEYFVTNNHTQQMEVRQ